VQLREQLAQQKVVQSFHQEVTLLREQIAKQREEREGTDSRIKELEEALLKQNKIDDALEEVLVRVSQGVDPTDEDMVDRKRMDSFFDYENGQEDEWRKLLLDFQPGNLTTSDTARRTNFSLTGVLEKNATTVHPDIVTEDSSPTFGKSSHIVDFDPEYVPSNNDEEHTAAPTSELSEPPIVIVPDTQSREELLTDEDLMHVLQSGTLPSEYGIPVHTHLEDYPGHNWKDPILPPPQAIACDDGEEGAWRCYNIHAGGDYYVTGRRTCPGCGVGQQAGAKVMDWTFDYYDRSVGRCAIFRRETFWTPRMDASLTRRTHNTAAQFMCELLAARFPALTMRDIIPYVCRPVSYTQRDIMAAVRALRE